MTSHNFQFQNTELSQVQELSTSSPRDWTRVPGNEEKCLQSHLFLGLTQSFLVCRGWFGVREEESWALGGEVPPGEASDPEDPLGVGRCRGGRGLGQVVILGETAM